MHLLPFHLVLRRHLCVVGLLHPKKPPNKDCSPCGLLLDCSLGTSTPCCVYCLAVSGSLIPAFCCTCLTNSWSRFNPPSPDSIDCMPPELLLLPLPPPDSIPPSPLSHHLLCHKSNDSTHDSVAIDC